MWIYFAWCYAISSSDAYWFCQEGNSPATKQAKPTTLAGPNEIFFGTGSVISLINCCVLLTSFNLSMKVVLNLAVI